MDAPLPRSFGFGERTRLRVQRSAPRRPQPSAPPRSIDHITTTDQNPSINNPPGQTIILCSATDCVDCAESETLRFAPKFCSISRYSSICCEKIKPNIGKYSDFGTPGGWGLFLPELASASHLKPLSPNCVLNSSFKIKTPKWPRFTPKNTHFLWASTPCRVDASGQGGSTVVKPRQARSTVSREKKITYEQYPCPIRTPQRALPKPLGEGRSEIRNDLCL
jgi:hypothetical protein